MNNALWGNRQPTGFWLREFRFEPWRGSRSADPKRTLPGGLTAGLLILDQVGGGSNPPWAASRIPLCGVNRPRGSGLRRWRSRSMFDAMAPFQDHHHNALIAQSGQSICLVSRGSPVRIRLGALPPPSGDAAIAQWQSVSLVRKRSRVQPPMVAPRLSVTTRCASGMRNRQSRRPSAHAGVFDGRAVPGKRRCTSPEGMGFRCGCSAAGSASRCQREGRGFESRLPLQHFSPSREVWGLVPAPASTEGSRGPCTARLRLADAERR